MVPVGNFLGQGQKFKRSFDVLFGQLDRIAAQFGMGLHDGPLRGSQFAGLVQNLVGDAHLADVVHGGRACQQADTAWRQCVLKAGVPFEQFGQQRHVALGTRQVLAGFGIACFGQVRQRANAHLLGQVVFGHAPGHFGFERGILILEPVACLLGLQLGAYPGQHNGRRDGFCDVVHRAQAQATLFLVRAGECGQENDRDAGAECVSLQCLQHLVAVHARHHHVKQYQIGPWRAAGHLQAAFAVVGGQHPVVRLQQFTQHKQVFWRVVHNQEGRAGRVIHAGFVQMGSLEIRWH